MSEINTSFVYFQELIERNRKAREYKRVYMKIYSKSQKARESAKRYRSTEKYKQKLRSPEYIKKHREYHKKYYATKNGRKKQNEYMKIYRTKEGVVARIKEKIQLRQLRSVLQKINNNVEYDVMRDIPKGRYSGKYFVRISTKPEKKIPLYVIESRVRTFFRLFERLEKSKAELQNINTQQTHYTRFIVESRFRKFFESIELIQNFIQLRYQGYQAQDENKETIKTQDMTEGIYP